MGQEQPFGPALGVGGEKLKGASLRFTDVTLTLIFRSDAGTHKSLKRLEATPGIEPGYTVLQTVA